MPSPVAHQPPCPPWALGLRAQCASPQSLVLLGWAGRRCWPGMQNRPLNTSAISCPGISLFPGPPEAPGHAAEA